jgi:hypothetical protein
MAGLALAGCASGPGKPAAPRPADEQVAALAEAERLYRAGDEAFAARRDVLATDPSAAFWLTRMLVRDVMFADQNRRATDEEFLAAAALGAEDPLRSRAIGQLRALGPAAVPALVQDLLQSEFPDRRELGIELLGRIGPPAMSALLPQMDSDDWRLRRSIVEVASALDGPEADEVLLRGAADAHFGVRAPALVGLLDRGEAHVPRARAVLAQDSDAFVRRKVAEALATHPDRDTAAALVTYYEDCLARGDRRGLEVADQSLRSISGHGRSGDLAFWRAWLASRPREGR